MPKKKMAAKAKKKVAVKAVGPTVRDMVETYYDVQNMRIQTGNRIAARVRLQKITPAEAKAAQDWFDDRLLAFEKEIKGRVQVSIKGHPLWEGFLSKVKGIGPCLAGGLVSWIENPAKFDTVSKLWRFFGQAVIDGKCERPKAGEKLHYNPKCKVLAWKIGSSFIKVKSKYRDLYDRKREFYKTKGGCNKVHGGKPCVETGHIHAMAQRATVKMFLSHTWAAWREIEGLPTRPPYPVEKLGHTTIIPWQEFLDRK